MLPQYYHHVYACVHEYNIPFVPRRDYNKYHYIIIRAAPRRFNSVRGSGERREKEIIYISHFFFIFFVRLHMSVFIIIKSMLTIVALVLF